MIEVISLIFLDRVGSVVGLVVPCRMALASLALLSLCGAGCGDPGPIGGIPAGVLEGDGDGATVEAGPAVPEAGAFDVSAPMDAFSTPDPFAGAPAYVGGTDTAMHLADTHHVGESCGNGSCHAAGACGAAPCFLIGGTVYGDYKGVTAAAGAEIRIVDTQGHAASCYAGPNGNFRITSDAGVTLPAIIGVRDATTTRPMVTTLANGMCGTSGCHNPMGSPATGAYYPVHVP